MLTLDNCVRVFPLVILSYPCKDHVLEGQQPTSPVISSQPRSEGKEPVQPLGLPPGSISLLLLNWLYVWANYPHPGQGSTGRLPCPPSYV